MSQTKKSNPPLSPLLSSKPRKPVDWLFVFKFNASEEPGDPKLLGKTGIFDARIHVNLCQATGVRQIETIPKRSHRLDLRGA